MWEMLKCYCTTLYLGSNALDAPLLAQDGGRGRGRGREREKEKDTTVIQKHEEHAKSIELDTHTHLQCPTHSDTDSDAGQVSHAGATTCRGQRLEVRSAWRW